MQKRYSESGLVLIEKYDKFLHYIYPHLQEIPRKHGILKEKIILLVFHQAELIYRVVKTKPINKTKLYELDAGLATIRHHLRFLADTRNVTIILDNETKKKIRKDGKFLLDNKRHNTSSILMAEVGRIIGAIVKDNR